MDDKALLEQYVEQGSEQAFSDLVERYYDMVFSVCIRHLQDPGLAQDAAQAVFVALSQKAKKVLKGRIVSGWLHKAAIYAAINIVRMESQRRKHEKEAGQMKKGKSAPVTEWEQAAPVLDRALVSLNEKDRSAVILRYFKDEPHAEVGRVLGISEDAAQMRITRAIGKLRKYFAKRGIAFSLGALTGFLTNNAVNTVSAESTEACISAVFGKTEGGKSVSADVNLIAKGIIKMMMWTKVKIAVAVLFIGVVAGTGGMIGFHMLVAGETEKKTNTPYVAGERPRISLDGEWEFALGKGGKDPVPAKFPYKVKVPGCFQAQGFGVDELPASLKGYDRKHHSSIHPSFVVPHLRREWAGPGWYRKVVNIPADWKGKRVWLFTGHHGSRSTGGFRVNGSPCRVPKTGPRIVLNCTGTGVDVTRLVKPGQENTFVASCPSGKGFWGWLCAGGLWRSVYLEATPGATWIAYAFISTEVENPSAKISVELGGAVPKGTWLEVGIRTWPDGPVKYRGKAKIKAGAKTPDVRIEMPGAELWSEAGPNLYVADLRLVLPSGEEDLRQVRFGVRSLKVKGIRILHNGKPIYLRGLTGGFRGMVDPITIMPNTDKEVLRRRVRVLKTLGFNYIRHHAQLGPPHPEWLEVCDEEGFFNKVDASWVHTRWVRLWRSSPSVIIFGLSNEQGGLEHKAKQMLEIADAVRSLDSDALFCPTDCGNLKLINAVPTKRRREKPVPNLPDRRREKEGEHTYQNKDVPLIPEDIARRVADVVSENTWLTHMGAKAMKFVTEKVKRPILMHEYGGITSWRIHWCGRFMDFTDRSKYTGGLRPFMFDEVEKLGRNMRVPDEELKLMGPASAMSQYLNLKSKFEVARLPIAEAYSGFDYLGYYNGPPCASPTDDFGEPTGPVEWLFAANGPTVLALDKYYLDKEKAGNYKGGLGFPERYAIKPGEKLSYPLMISHYSERPIERGKLAWKLTKGEKVLSKGTFPVNPVKVGELRKLGDLSFAAPQTNMATKIELHVNLTAGEVKAANSWYFYVVPETKPGLGNEVAAHSSLAKSSLPALKSATPWKLGTTPKLLLTAQLSDEVLDLLEKGGNIFLVGNGGLPETHDVDHFHSGPGYRGYPGYNWGVLLRKHPALQEFPHEGWGDWPWLRMASGKMYDLGKWAKHPTVIVRSIPSFHTAVFQNRAGLFEARVGKGRLLACSLKLEKAPVGEYLFGCLVRYALGKEFNPDIEMTIKDLKKALALGTAAH